MTELEVRAGPELERRMERYARVRLEPSAAQAKRARAALMEAAWRQRIAGRDASAPAGSAASSQPRTPGAAARPLFTGWGGRRLGASFAAAVLAGLLVGSTAFAASRAGGPLYEARLTLEELTLPMDSAARLEAELAFAQGRLAEIVDAVARGDAAAVDAAVQGYLRALDDLDGATGGPADRAQSAVQFHLTILQEVLAKAPAAARSGLQQAITAGSRAATALDNAGTLPDTTPGTGGGNGGNGGGGAGGSGSGSGSGGGSGGGSNGQPNGGAGGPAKSAEPGRPERTPAPAATPAPGRTPAPARPPGPTRTAGPVETATPKPPKETKAPETKDERPGADPDEDRRGSLIGNP